MSFVSLSPPSFEHRTLTNWAGAHKSVGAVGQLPAAEFFFPPLHTQRVGGLRASQDGEQVCV